MKKKILALCLVVVLAVTAVTGATLAYFTDKDADVNVMTTGNIQIIQNETDRNGKAWSDTNTKPLLPAVYLKPDAEGKMVPYNPATSGEGPGGYQSQFDEQGNDRWYTGTMDNTNGEGTVKIYDDNIENEIDKVVSVTNNGNVDAYVRTLIMLEDTNNASDNLHLFYSGKDVATTTVVDNVQIGDATYEVWVFTYVNALEAGETSAPSLKQIFLNPKTDSEWYKKLGDDGNLTIIALSQAAQTTGFDTPAEALNTAFGVVDATNINKWIAETNIDTTGANNVINGTVEATPKTVAATMG